ncbi:hypothetical protein [Archangium sp.]|uniref:hypothetical protein n=1 Tax=Archangium sp. TaxID=1872627 RepID=UPI002D74057E|nr:hypothetical protein [Archangium sp.]HYO53509.1 hypothetical protein [Archangium sp.]
MKKQAQQQPPKQEQLTEKKQLTLEELDQVVGGGLAIKIVQHKDFDSETGLVEI